MTSLELDKAAEDLPVDLVPGANLRESSTLDIAGFYKMQFFRQPNWRYLRAQEILSVGALEYHIDDLPTLSLVSALAGDSQANPHLPTWKQDLRHWKMAVQLHCNQNHLALRTEIEARLLAGQDPPTVAERVQLPTSAIEAYEQACFDIRDRLEVVDYMATMVLELPDKTPGSPANSLLLKRCSYCLGTSAVEYLLFAFNAGDPQAVAAVLKQLPHHRLTHRLLSKSRRTSTAECLEDGLQELLGIRLGDLVGDCPADERSCDQGVLEALWRQAG